MIVLFSFITLVITYEVLNNIRQTACYCQCHPVFVESYALLIVRVFNLSLKKGVVPFEWKEANIIPLFKKGSRNKSENYRPVSLTSVICKLLERLIKDHMVDFLVKHKLLNSSQHGFLKARSCLTNILFFGRNH